MQAEELNAFVANYIQNYKLKSAVMLDGVWGTGKSYYIEKSLVPYLKENISKDFHCVVLSLYGVSSLDEISKQLFWEIKFKNRAKAFKGIAAVGKTVLKGVTSYFNVDLDGSELAEKLYSSVNLDKTLIIFEDVERLDKNVGIANFLGFVNNLVEHDGGKALVVANEKELIKRCEYEAKEGGEDDGAKYGRISFYQGKDGQRHAFVYARLLRDC